MDGDGVVTKAFKESIKRQSMEWNMAREIYISMCSGKLSGMHVNYKEIYATAWRAAKAWHSEETGEV